jgi:hypothetical protein
VQNLSARSASPALNQLLSPLLAQARGLSVAGSTVTEVPGSHSIYVSQPAAVAAIITQAAAAAGK